MSQKRKDILSSLIGSKNNFSDIISGKSGGIVILSTGESGLGKTLTAEVYSELLEKPLYSIQSSQLGISVSDIEINLNKVLNRAEKWDAVLLIDEADSYIAKRGSDILQNCIVGTFLRLMEYYNGVLFLTSNRPNDIDDAIMSRVTMLFKYDYPTKDESIELWEMLAKNFNKEILKSDLQDIIEAYPKLSGRDIRNTFKNLSKIYPKEKQVKLDMIKYIEEYLPFINPLQ
jgi:SpoVK/Ycf46/Vps4 family AAA+-type ATPase